MSRYAAVTDPLVAVSELSRQITVVTLPGDHDIASEDLLRETLQDLVRKRVSVLVDLSDTSFIDCSVVRVLDEAAADAEKMHVGMAFHVGQQSVVEKMIYLTGAASRWRIYHDRDSAISLLNSHAVAS